LIGKGTHPARKEKLGPCQSPNKGGRYSLKNNLIRKRKEGRFKKLGERLIANGKGQWGGKSLKIKK